MLCATKSDVGRHRTANEDNCAVNLDHALFVIADGMGGHERGDVASALAVNTVLDCFRHGLAVPASAKQELDLLRNATLQAHRQVVLENAETSGTSSMGTTLIIASLRDDTLQFAHVGDSRLYVIDTTGGIARLTSDQTLAEQMRKQGTDPEQITRKHNSTLLQAIGLEGFVVPATGTRQMSQGESLLMCTDGLSDLVAEADMVDVIRKHGDNVEEAADSLVALANEAGGSDNITVILTRI